MSHSLDAICLLLKDLDLKQLQLVRSRVNYEIDVKASHEEDDQFDVIDSHDEDDQLDCSLETLIKRQWTRAQPKMKTKSVKKRRVTKEELDRDLDQIEKNINLYRESITNE
jgi:hypothetical protein